MYEDDDSDYDPDAKPLWARPENVSASGRGASVNEAPSRFDAELEVEVPTPGLKTRHCEIARLHASGMTNNDIADKLGYTAARICVLLKEPFIQAEVQRWRDQLFDSDDIALMKQGAHDAIHRMLKLVSDPRTKPETLLRIGQFFVEQAHGKARQGIDIKSSSLDAFLGLAEKAIAMGSSQFDSIAALPEARRTEEPTEAESAPPAPVLDAVDAYFAKTAK